MVYQSLSPQFYTESIIYEDHGRQIRSIHTAHAICLNVIKTDCREVTFRMR